MTKGEQAEILFKEGYNCSQSVACAFAPELGLPIETVAKMVSGFGGGFGRLREVCGAVSGMTFVTSALCGYSDPTATDEKADVYAMIQTLADAFKQQTGSLLCRELLALPEGEETSAVPAARTETYYQKRPCAMLCHIAADLAAAQITKQKE
ncbi:MAG: C-GCAxxG-C-C family protein [Ruthenibacterium sp.]